MQQESEETIGEVAAGGLLLGFPALKMEEAARQGMGSLQNPVRLEQGFHPRAPKFRHAHC